MGGFPGRMPLPTGIIPVYPFGELRRSRGGFYEEVSNENTQDEDPV